MADVREFKAVEGGKKDPCLYCGKPEHPVPLACPRISAIWIDDGNVSCIEFHDDWTPDDAA